jgi:hypothetical protein
VINVGDNAEISNERLIDHDACVLAFPGTNRPTSIPNGGIGFPVN